MSCFCFFVVYISLLPIAYLYLIFSARQTAGTRRVQIIFGRRRLPRRSALLIYSVFIWFLCPRVYTSVRLTFVSTRRAVLSRVFYIFLRCDYYMLDLRSKKKRVRDNVFSHFPPLSLARAIVYLRPAKFSRAIRSLTRVKVHDNSQRPPNRRRARTRTRNETHRSPRLLRRRRRHCENTHRRIRVFTFARVARGTRNVAENPACRFPGCSSASRTLPLVEVPTPIRPMPKASSCPLAKR